MPTNTSGGTTTSFVNTPQAKDDIFGATEDGIFTIDVMANDLGGNAKVLWSIDDTTMTDDSGNGTYDLVAKDAAMVPEFSDLGARIWIENGVVKYDSNPIDYLALGQQVVDKFTYAIRLSNGTLSWATVYVTLTGTNDNATLTSATATGSVVEDSAQTPSATDSNQAVGTISFTDADLADTHTATFAAAASNTTTLGSFALGSVNEAPNAANGSVGWTYTINEAAAQYLAAGQVATEVYVVTIDDGHGSTITQNVTVTITGTNDQPDIRAIAGDTASAALPETNGGLSTNGTLTVTDVDTNDTISTTVAVTNVTGPANGLTNADFLAMFSVTPTSGLAANSGDTHNLGWDFNSGSQAFNYLRAGQSLQLTYTLTVDDNHGGTDTQTVTVTVTGTNDAPVLSDTTDPSAVLELGDASAQNLSPIIGSFSVTDLDIGDTLDASVIGGATVLLNGSPYVLPGGAGALTAAGAFTVTDTTSNGGAASIGYTYDPSGADLDFLREGDSLTITYTVQVNDGTANSGTQTVTFTITGTNDAPVLTVDAIGAVIEDATDPALTDTGTLSFTDADVGDGHTVGSSYNGDASWSGGGLLTPAQITALTSGFSTDTNSWDYSVANAAVDFLAAGETITLSFDVTVTDDSGAGNDSDTETVTITITGTNDAPTIVSATDAGDVTEKAEPAEGGTLSDDGTITIADVDLNDTHSASVSATVRDENGDPVATPLGSLSLGSVNQGANSVDWTFNVADSALDFLAEGETRTQVYTITVSDGHVGGTVTQDVTITITGTNDKPTITTADDTGDVTENGTLSASGEIDFADVDLADSHTVDYTPGDTGYLGTFSVGVDNASTGDGAGQVGWDFSVNNADIQYLAEGQELVQTYTVTIDDGQGGTVDQLVTVTITGTNDDPDIHVEAGDSASATIPEANGTLTTGGTLTVTDVDTADTISTAIALTNVTGNQGSLSNAALLDMLSVTPDSGLPADTGDSNNLAWNFDSDGEAFNYLAPGQSLQLTYTLTVSDGSGGDDTQTVTVTITGTNDAPVLTGDRAAPINEGGTYQLTTADVNFTDPDDNAANVTFTISGLSNGTLYVNGSPSLTFTGQQLVDGLVSFTHDGSETLAAGFNISVEDGNEDVSAPVAQPFSFTVTPVNDAPANTVPAGQSVNEDQTLVFNTANGNAISIADVDAGSNNVQVTLSVASGTLTLGSLAGLSVAGGANGSSTVTVQGTLAAINAGLQGLTYQGNLNFNGGDSLSITTSDLGNTGLGGAQSDSDSVAITVNAVNDAPVNSMPASFTTQEDVHLVLSGLSVSDVDAAPGNVTVTLSVDSGAIFMGSSISVATTGNGTNSISITGTVAAVNAFLANPGVQPEYWPASNANGPVTLTMTTTDNGNTGLGGAQTDTDTRTINVTPVNDFPHLDNSIADQSFNEDTAWNWTVPAGTFSDIDGDTLTYTAELSDGNPLPAWLHFDGPTQTFSGTPPQDFNGSYIVRVIASDGSLTASDTFDLTVLAVNDAPVNALPASYSTNENTALRLSGLSVSDVDAAAGNISVTLLVASGSLTAANAGGVTVSGSGTGSITLNGTLSAINAYLATVANQPTFTPAANTSGSVTLAMSTGDNGNTGSGGAQFDTDMCTINVVHVGAAPTDIVFTLAASTANLTGNGINPGMTLGSLSAVDADSSTWTFTIGSVAGQLLPAVTASPASGSSVNLVTSGSVASGNYQFTVTATDAQGQSFTETYTLSVGTNGGDNTAFFTISAGTDISLGLNGQDTINGGAGDDALVGGQNADTLNGGLGNDQLVGGAGGDNFLFNTTLNGTTNVDQILDFDASGGGNGDHIQLDDAIFTQLTPGTLAAGNFASNPGGVAADGNDYVLFDSVTGNLYYDADGNGGGQRILIAHLTVVAGTIDPTDILIV